MNYCRLRPDVDMNNSDGLYEEVGNDVAVFVDDGEKVDVLYRKKHHYYTHDEFERDWEIAHDGAEVRSATMSDTFRKMQEVDAEFVEVTQSLAAVSPQALLSNDSTSAPMSRTEMVTAAKLHIGQAKQSALAMKEKIQMQVAAAQALVAEQVTALELRSKELKEMLAKAEECVWTLNLYVGTDEDIVQLREGEPAPKDDRIVIRQLILFMDEESTAVAARGGIDVTNVELFDKWIKKKRNLQTVFPESKGIVAFHIRRTSFCYDDPWDERKNEENIKNTYLLIRNGERLWRVQIDMLLGNHLFPTAAEFDNLFIDSRTGERIRPDHCRYNEMMEEADSRTRHYMRILLVLQGLIDRTDFFQPYPDGRARLNVCDTADYNSYLRFIYDAENLLSTDHLDWSDWLKEVNGSLTVGCRIVGKFSGYGVSGELYPRERYERGRITPATANRPDSLTLHTIEDTTDDDGFVIRYERTDTICDRYGRSKMPTVRARCVLYKYDRFILNFDAVTVEDLEYYINSRRQRKNYVEMIPLLRCCLKLKKEELAEEAPFKELLIGKVYEEHNLDRHNSVAIIDEVINWWKFKNRQHRALKESDALAYSMIMAEIGTRLRKESQRREFLNRATCDQILAAVTNRGERKPLLVAHKDGNKFVALFPMTENNVWVREETWTLNRATREVYQNEAKDWRLVDGRYLKWVIIESSDRWAVDGEIVWKINPRRKDYLTYDEAKSLADTALEMLKERYTNERRWDKSSRFVPLVTRIYNDSHVEVVCSTERPKLNKKYRSDEPQMPGFSIKRYRMLNGQINLAENYSLRLNHHDLDAIEAVRSKDATLQTIQVFPENIEQIRGEIVDITVATMQYKRMERTAEHLASLYDSHCQEIGLKNERDDYVAKYGSDLGFKQSKDGYHYNDWQMRNLILECFDHNFPVNGVSIGEILEQDWAKGWTKGDNKLDDRIDRNWKFPQPELLTSDSSS